MKIKKLKKGHISKTGRKIRATRRYNDVERFVAQYNIGGKDQRDIANTLQRDIHTKKGFERSKKIQDHIKNNNMKSLKRFKEFKNLKGDSITQIARQLRDDSEFYNEQRELIMKYNKLSPEEKKNERNLIKLELQREHRDWSFEKARRER